MILHLYHVSCTTCRVGLGAGERTIWKGAARAGGCCSRRHIEWSDRGKQGCISLHLLWRQPPEDSSGDSAVDSLRTCIPCPYEEQVHTSCVLDRVECLTSGQEDPQPCVTCRSECPARNRPPHPAETAEDLPGPLPGERWPAVEGAL